MGPISRAVTWLMNQVGYAICHQFAERSLSYGCRTLPVCARDAGLFLGFAACFAALLAFYGRAPRRSASWPKLAALALFILPTVIDAATSYAGLVLFMQFFTALSFKSRLRQCFRHQSIGKIYSPATVFLQLVVHLLLGFRELRDCRAYRHDPLVQRILGLKRLPDVATLSRMLKDADPHGVENLRRLLREMLFERLAKMGLTRITLDFDGSVQSTRRHAEGTAVGYNKKRKGARSYYPLFCTIAQTAQVLDFLHRSGNVHDSQGARPFILACVQAVRAALPGIIVEVRMDSAFFSDETVTALQQDHIEFTISVPFERFVELKSMIEQRRRWRKINREVSYFEDDWKPKVWDARFRFLFIRTLAERQHKEPIQLDLFIPQTYGYQSTVIVTNKTIGMRKVLRFHHGRGYQEKVFGELKSQSQMDYIAVRRLFGNQLYLMTAVLAHNLAREIQMRAEPKARGTTERRTPLWHFEELATLRHHVLQRAGRFTWPKGKLTLTITDNPALRKDIARFLDALKEAA